MEEFIRKINQINQKIQEMLTSELLTYEEIEELRFYVFKNECIINLLKGIPFEKLLERINKDDPAEFSEFNEIKIKFLNEAQSFITSQDDISNNPCIIEDTFPAVLKLYCNKSEFI